MARTKTTPRKADDKGKLPKRKRPRIDIKNPKFWGHTAKHTFVEPMTGTLPFHAGTRMYNYKSKFKQYSTTVHQLNAVRSKSRYFMVQHSTVY